MKMDFSSRPESNSSLITNNSKMIALESSLQQSMVKYKDLVLDLEQLHIDSENYRVQYLTVKDNCENKICRAAEELKKIIAAKDHIILSVASALTKLNETKNFNILADAFKILFEETSPLTTLIEDKQNPCTSTASTKHISPKTKNISPKKELETCITEDVSNKEESLSEIEGTPTGRSSPIIHTKKARNILAKSSDFRDKKKCPDEWPTSDSKSIKLMYPTPTKSKSGSKLSGKLRQTRFSFVKLKNTITVDLTCSPEVLEQKGDQLVQPLIKKGSIENDDTILPSPTSGPTDFTFLKSISKASPSKFKKPQLSLKSKRENNTKQDENNDASKNETKTDMEESINILKPFATRLQNDLKEEKKTPIKKHIPQDDDTTHCDTNASISVLQGIDQLKEEYRNLLHSPAKQPLGENINIVNTPPLNDAESSMSILRPDIIPAAVENVKRKIPELVEPVYKEPTVRKKAEKRNLQGWSCEECMNFYGELYKKDPVMLAKKINECSKHRGRHNPARPKTPPNFWNPRWHVPEDTEELNRMNNAD